MMKIRAALMLAVASIAAPWCNAQSFITGTVPAGTYSFSGDVFIYDTTVALGAHGETTLTVIAKDGTIDVGDFAGASFGIHGFGLDGPPQVDGTAGVLPVAGQPASAPFNVSLETIRSDHGTAACEIIVGRPIDCHGGNGGSGGNGYFGYFVDCNYVDAQSGATARPGTGKAAISIQSAGNIWISDKLDVSGGNGGNGGSAGSGIIGVPGFAMPGGDGGAGGNIVLEHTAQAPTTAVCSLSSAIYGTASLYAFGGSAGNGGSGASGNGSASPGTNAGNGGQGGAISATVHHLSMGSATPGGTHMNTQGGGGGAGGTGGSGGVSQCYEYSCSTGTYHKAIGASAGSNAGQGGSGGSGGPVAISSAGSSVSLGLYCDVISNGGPGAASGGAGHGGVYQGYGTPCDDGVDCTGFSGFSGGSIFQSGKGGAAGAISVIAKQLTMSASTSGTAIMSAVGGDGAAGVASAGPGIFCCGGRLHGGAGSQGGGAGSGGAGANITLTIAGFSASLSQFFTCGGMGANGGAGSTGVPVGVGGVGGSSGTPGAVILNGVTEPNGCTITRWPDGDVGPPLDGFCG